MQTPLRITFRQLKSTSALESYVRDRAAKLDEVHGRLTGCHVALESPHRHKTHGNGYRARLDLAIPGDELVVEVVHEDLYAAVDAAFDRAHRVLGDRFRRASTRRRMAG